MARVRYRQLEMAMAGRFRESAVLADRAKRVREIADVMDVDICEPAHPNARNSPPTGIDSRNKAVIVG